MFGIKQKSASSTKPAFFYPVMLYLVLLLKTTDFVTIK